MAKQFIQGKWRHVSVICFFLYLTLCSAEYRTIDGSTNNENNPEWGAGSRPFARALPADYCTSIGNTAPRCQKDGSPLPSAREASYMLLQPQGTGTNVPDPPDSRKLTTLHMAFGQFLAHDVGLSRPATKETQESCNAVGTYRPSRPSVPPSECLHIPVESGDPVYNKTVHPFLPFIRDQRVEEEQINLQTSWIDLSLVYGSTEQILQRLLEDPANSAKLKLRPPPNYHQDCERKGILPRCPDGSCEFDAGDPRLPEQAQLTAIHTIFAREHNRIVDELMPNHKDWSARKLLEEARKINIAQWQHIVYTEYLPTLLGRKLPRGATLKRKGFSKDYDPTINPSTSNTFMTVTFRFGHTQIQESLLLVNNKYVTKRIIPFNEIFFNTTLVLEGKIDQIIHGTIKQDAEKSDDLFNRVISSKFNVKDTEILGEDLVALDIHRSRDHGISGYNAARRACNLPPISRKEFQKFNKVYKGHPDDIDFFVGGMMERPVGKAIVGETFSCMLGRDFANYRLGDRFWYEREGMFEKDQLAEIRKSSMARVLCDNLDNMKKVQKKPLEQSKRRFRCENIRKLDYTLF